MVGTHFGKLPRKAPNAAIQASNFIKPKFCDELCLLNSEDMHPDHLNIAFLQEAPSWRDPDYFATLLVQRILGDKPMSHLDIQLSNGNVLIFDFIYFDIFAIPFQNPS